MRIVALLVATALIAVVRTVNNEPKMSRLSDKWTEDAASTKVDAHLTATTELDRSSATVSTALYHSGQAVVPTELAAIPPPPADILPANGYKGWYCNYSTKNGVTTYTYTITRLDGSTYTKDVVVDAGSGSDAAALAPPAAWTMCGTSDKCRPTAEQLAKGDQQAAEASPLNARVLKEAYKNYGKQVDRGECWDVANEAFLAAGAQAPDGYVWSNKQVPLKDCQAGDVLQFSWAKFETKITHADGSWNTYFKSAGSAASKGAHTALVFDNEGDLVMSVLEQNVGGVRKEMFNTYDFGAMTSGSVKCYQPEAAAAMNASNRRRKHHR